MKVKTIKKIVCFSILLGLFQFNAFAVQMVEVSVDIIEVKQTKEENKGVSWNDVLRFEEGMKETNYLNLNESDPKRGIAPSAFSIGSVERVEPLAAALRLMIKDNVARILANPKLATESGSQASFLVGGEIPVPVVSPQGVSIEWKTYGINLQIRPNVIGKGKKVSAMIQVSVSDLDYANSVKLQGYDVPALLNRSANSKVTVSDGGTVVIAGLKQARKETTEQKVPILGSLPVIGWFFKSTTERDMETSMVVFVTFKVLEKK
ncbi:hypothetical protein ACFL5N_02760 [bacterium]